MGCPRHQPPAPSNRGYQVMLCQGVVSEPGQPTEVQMVRKGFLHVTEVRLPQFSLPVCSCHFCYLLIPLETLHAFQPRFVHTVSSHMPLQISTSVLPCLASKRPRFKFRMGEDVVQSTWVVEAVAAMSLLSRPSAQ